MPKPPKPALSIVSPETVAISPPRELGQSGRELWDAIQREFGIDDRAGCELLVQACGALDMVEALGVAIARDGAIVYSRAGPRVHPAVKDQLGCRAFIVKTLEKLGVTVESIRPVGRPPAGGLGWSGSE